MTETTTAPGGATGGGDTGREQVVSTPIIPRQGIERKPSTELFCSIPALKELTLRKQWVGWRWVTKTDGKRTKNPVNPHTGKMAATDNVETWGTAEQALAAMKKFRLDGVGYVFSKANPENETLPDDPYSGVDYDDCVDENGIVDKEAWGMAKVLDSYAEISPSGKGIKVFLKGTLPPRGRVAHPIEMYDRGRFFTVTGRHLNWTPNTINERQEQLAVLHKKVFGSRHTSPNGKNPGESGGSRLSDEQILAKATVAKNAARFISLWDGDISAHPSASEADQSLCDRLAFWTRDPEQIDRLFRRSGLFRGDKWDEVHHSDGRTYGEGTIQNALEYVTEHYASRGGDGASPHQPHPRKEIPWPDPLDEAAYHGLVGDIVRAIEPHTEADPAAVLIQVLAAFGNAVGHSPHFRAEADRHTLNLFAVLVGETAKGRKGTSWGQARQVFWSADFTWTTERIQAGLSSGEGLIWAVRDAISKTEPIKEKGRATGEYQDIVIDQGVEDKRLLVLESEFASVLRIMMRDGSTLSAIVRQAWDNGDLRVLTKNSPAKATAAHISIVGHITKDELLRYLDSTECGNGFANRFLWLCVRRSKVLPEGGHIDEVDFSDLIERLDAALAFGSEVGELRRDEEARAIWYEVYPDLSAGKPGLLGAVTSRAEAQVMRLACIYALLDRSAVIRRKHMLAALSLWEYCEASAAWVFGDTLGDPLADQILTALRNNLDGLTRTDISKVFSRNQSAGQIERALGVLVQRGLAHSEQHETEGRPAEVWYAN